MQDPHPGKSACTTGVAIGTSLQTAPEKGNGLSEPGCPWRTCLFVDGVCRRMVERRGDIAGQRRHDTGSAKSTELIGDQRGTPALRETVAGTSALLDHQRPTDAALAAVFPQVKVLVETRRVERSVEGSNPRQEPEPACDALSGYRTVSTSHD
jgi:hypothetical protein